MVRNSFTVVTVKHMYSFGASFLVLSYLHGNTGKNPDRILATSSHFPQCKRCLGEQGVVSGTSSAPRELF